MKITDVPIGSIITVDNVDIVIMGHFNHYVYGVVNGLSINNSVIFSDGYELPAIEKDKY